MPTLAARIKQVRTSMGMSQSAFAEYFDISQTHVSKIENGKDSPSDKFLKRISLVAEVNYDWLSTGTGTMYNSDDGMSEALDDALDSFSVMFRTISELSKELDVNDRKCIFDMLIIIRDIMYNGYKEPSDKSIAIHAMRKVFAASFITFIGIGEKFGVTQTTGNKQNSIDKLKHFDELELRWRKECEDALKIVKEKFIYRDIV